MKRRIGSVHLDAMIEAYLDWREQSDSAWDRVPGLTDRERETVRAVGLVLADPMHPERGWCLIRPRHRSDHRDGGPPTGPPPLPASPRRCAPR